MGMIHKKSRTTGRRPRRTGEKVGSIPSKFWRASICILGAEIVLGVLYRKGGAQKKVVLQLLPISLLGEGGPAIASIVQWTLS